MDFLAILLSLEWICEQSYLFTRIYSDSLSKLQVIFAHRTKHPTNLKIIEKQLISVHKTTLGYVSAQIDIEGYKRDDPQAKVTIEYLTINTNSLCFFSIVKRILNERIPPALQAKRDDSDNHT